MQKINSQTNQAIPNFVFFGGPEISVDFLDELTKEGILPSLIVTTPDKPAGRKLVLTSPPLKLWADEHDIPVIQPQSLKKDFDSTSLKDFDLFVVVAYGKIIPQSLLDIPQYGSINLHPSLLPLYRGPSPIQSAMLADDKETGLSLMLLDAEMDHGPIIGQKTIVIDEWKKNRDMEYWFATEGAQFFMEIVPLYLEHGISSEQDHAKATECIKYEKSDMEIDPRNPRLSYLTYCAFDKPFFFMGDLRVIVSKAVWEKDDFKIQKVIPAGKKEQDWEVFKESRQS